MERPKYYIGRTVIIYILTLLTGTFFSSLVLGKFSSFSGDSSLYLENVLVYFVFGLMTTAVLCIPIIFVLIFGFMHIYKNHIDAESTRKKLLTLSLICVISPLLLTIIYTFVNSFSRMNFMIFPELIIWTVVMIFYVLSGLFYILYVSRFYDKRNPPLKENNHIPLIEDVLDSGLDEDI